MNDIMIRRADEKDADSILTLFLEQFPFLRECADRALQDVVYRIERPDSVTVVAVRGEQLMGVARGYEQNSIYLMNSICTASSLSLLDRSRVLLALLPYFIRTCIAHAEQLGITKAFYGTDVKSLARLVPMLCNINGFCLTPGHYNEEDGFWIMREVVTR
jgi:hypothetical protein